MTSFTTPITPLQAGGEMFQRAKTASFLDARSSTARPLSEATELHETDFEDDSDLEDYSPKPSFETDERRSSQTTLSSYDEAPTPSSSRSQPQFGLRFRPVEGPRGPHLFRSSQASSDYSFDYALQMSPLLPKHPPPRTETAFSEETVTPVTRQTQLDEDFSIATALHNALNSAQSDETDPLSTIRTWSPQQVIDWMYTAGIDASVIECFERHDVDGAVISDIQFEELKELDIHSFGKRHQVWNAICDLRGDEVRPSPQPTPFQDISRPCTTSNRRSPSRSRSACQTPINGDETPIEPGKKRRGRKGPKQLDMITPQESVSIVAIEQLLPKPHKCAKGERCAKWRKQQRELQQLKDENAIGRFPISPGKGGRVFVRGDPGNATTADNMIPNVRLQPLEEPLRPNSDAIPSVVASSDLLGPGQLPEFALHSDMLDQLDKRDPQDNVRQFLNFQHFQSPASPLDDAPPTPPLDVFTSQRAPITRAESVPPLFPAQHHQAYPSLNPTTFQSTGPRQQLRHLPRLDIPGRSATAGPNLGSGIDTAVPESAATSVCRSATASPAQLYRLGTPASEVDVPVTAISNGPIVRDASASVPPNMQYRPQHHIARSASRADWRRPSMALPIVKEGEVFSPISNSDTKRPGLAVRSRSDSDSVAKPAVRDPAHHSPTTKQFGYGGDCTQSGWMKKRKTKMLRHEWQDAHFRLKGTNLGMYPNARLSSAEMDSINVDDYSVACSTVASNGKLSAAMKAFKIKDDASKKDGKGADATAFAFQLVPSSKEDEKKRHHAASGKTHHFAVKSKDDRIDWMRELMLAKARQQKRDGYDVEVNGAQV